MRLAVTKILIFIFMGLFTALSLAETPTSREKRANALINQLRLSKPVDLTVNRAAPKTPVARRPASIKKPIPWVQVPFFDIGDWFGRGKLFGKNDKDGENTGMNDHDHDHDHTGHDHANEDLGIGSYDANGKLKGDKAVGFGYDDNRAKEKGAPPPPPTPPQKENPPGKIPDPQRPPVQVHGLYWPVCMMFPPSVEAKADAIAKRFVEIANQCQVNINLVAIPINEPTDPRDADAITDGGIKTCNAQFGLGVPQASAMVATNNAITADVMCRQYEELRDDGSCPGEMYNGKCYKTNTAGCAALCKQSNITPDQLTNSRNQGHGNGGQKEGIIPSIIDAGGQTGAVASHEAMGHSQMCWPNGHGGGNGTGIPGEDKNGGFKEGPTDGSYTYAGCAQMRANAYPNTNKIGFDPGFSDYYTASDKRWTLGEPYWLPYGNPQPPPQIAQQRPPPGGPGGGPPSGNPPGQEPVARQAPQSANPQNAPPPSGHKKKPGGATPLTVVSLRNGTAGQDALNGIPDVPGGTGKPGGTETFGYDESNLKNVVSGNATSGAGGGAGGVKGFGYDENNAKLAADGSGGSGAGGPGGAEAGVVGAGGETGAPGAAGVSGRGPASILNDVKNNSANMDDAFWKKLKQPPKEEAPGLRGSSLRGYDKPAKPLYQGGAVGP